MTEKLLQACDAMALVRESEDSVAKEYVRKALETVSLAATKAITFITADQHPNPDVHEKIAKGFEALGYRVQVLENDRIKISWSK